MIDDEDESFRTDTADEIRAAFGSVIGAILDGYEAPPGGGKVVEEVLLAQERIRRILAQRKTQKRASLRCGCELDYIDPTKETFMSEVKKCEATIGDLEHKRAACTKRGTELADERAAVALDAHTGNAKAAKRLAEIHSAIAMHGSELASLDAAIKAAGERLRQAQEAEARAEERRIALEIRKLAKELKEAGRIADEGLAMFADATNAMHHIVCRLNALGLGNPSALQFVSLGERAVRTVLMETAFRRAFEQ